MSKAVEAISSDTSTRMSRKHRAAQRQALKRADIVDAAAQLFEARGYFTTSVGDIAQQVGIEKPTLYHYFKSKEQILYEIHESFASQIVDAHKAAVAQTDDPLEQLEAIFLSFFKVMQEKRAHVRTFFFYFDELKNGVYRNKINRRRQQLSDLVQGAIEECIQAGIFRPMNPRLAMLVVTGIFNWAPQWYNPSGPMQPKELTAFVSDIVLGGMQTNKSAGTKVSNRNRRPGPSGR
jgi:AcrR family transcriptional regulator